MKRLLRILSLYSQHALEYKARSFVWFFVIVIDVFIYMLYWRGVLIGGSNAISWTFPQIMSYYLLLLVAGTFLQVHIEEEVAFEDIQYGKLSQYLMRPFSYLGFKFFQELPWRIIQGGFGLMTLFFVSVLFVRLQVVSDVRVIPVVIGIVVSAYFLCFIYKMIMGIMAFWTVDFSGLHNIQSIVFIIGSGMLVPLHLLPDSIRGFALLQPIAYMLYYPVVAVQGGFSSGELWRVLGMQWVWLVALYGIYRIMWRAGLKQYTAVGQ